MTFTQWEEITNFPIYQKRLKVALVHARTRPVKFWFFDPFSFGAKKGSLLLLGKIDPKLIAEVEKKAGRAKGRGRCSVNSENQVVLQIGAGSVVEDKLNLALRLANTNLTGIVSSEPMTEEPAEPDTGAALAEITQRRKGIIARVDALRMKAELSPAATKSIHAALAELGRLWARDPLSTAELLDTIDTQLLPLERTGLHPHHQRKFEKMAIEKNQIVMVRCANVKSLDYQGHKGCCPKPVTCKAKTAEYGDQAGLVVDPAHPAQNRAWKEALLKADSKAEQLKIAASRQTAIKEWAVFKKDQLDQPNSGYNVDSTTGVVSFHGDKVHGDVDLHGVFSLPAQSDNAPERVDYGAGNIKVIDERGEEKEVREDPVAVVRRGEINKRLNPVGRQTQDPVQHGGEADSAKHRNDPNPPIIAFTPQGRVVLEDVAAVKKFYLERGLRWPPG